MSSSGEKVKDYFDKTAEEYDSFFQKTPKMNFAQKLGHRFFRKPYVYRRLNAVIELSGDVGGKRILEVGCGSGRYSVELAKRGAIVTGLDFSPNMVKVSQRLAQSENVKNCDFVVADIFEYSPGKKFDVVICSGVFDYMTKEEAQKLIGKLRDLSKDAVVVTYPKLFNIQVPVRKIWLTKRGVPVYFYTKKKMSKIFKDARLKEIREIDIGPLVIKRGIL